MTEQIAGQATEQAAGSHGGLRILILFAHPALEKSRVNRRLIAAVRDLPGITFHDLYEAYPDFHISVPHEQKLLETHDVVVMQHPFFWYSTPAILKEWQDLVLEHGWAYGSAGVALRGKRLLSVITAGGREAAYRHGGFNHYTIRELLRPLEQTARLCGMDYLPPFVAHGTHGMTEETLRHHARDYRRLVEALRDEVLDCETTRELSRLNLDVEALLGPEKGDEDAR